MKPFKFFIDFDGTVTTEDVVDRVLDRFAPASWKEIEKDWVEGKIGSRECLRRQMELVRATPEAFAALLGEIHLDPHFVSFLRTARELSVPVSIVSDGFDMIIRGILGRKLEGDRELLTDLPVYCNRLVWDGSCFRAGFPHGECLHGCANCKEALIRKLASPEDRVIFVGDGWSDRFAAGIASLTFAKEELLKYCIDHRIVHSSFTNFGDIAGWLEAESKLTDMEDEAPRCVAGTR